MKRTLTRHALAALLACAVTAACSNQKPATTATSSADQAGYAERYPNELSQTRARFIEHESRSGRVVQEFSTYPDALNDPSWSHVEAVVDRADQAGKSSTYADQHAENQAVEDFFSEEKTEINNRVAGAVNYTAKQKGVKADGLAGAAVHGLDKAVEKQLEERLRAHNEAHRFIDDNEEALGKANLEKLRTQADDISYVSYVVYVGIPQARDRLQSMIDEASGVRSTLQRTIDESNAIAADPSRSDAEKAAAQKRATAASEAQAKLDSEVQQAQHVLTELEERQKKLQQDYEAALDQLKQKLQERAAQTPAEPATS